MMVPAALVLKVEEPAQGLTLFQPPCWAAGCYPLLSAGELP